MIVEFSLIITSRLSLNVQHCTPCPHMGEDPWHGPGRPFNVLACGVDGKFGLNSCLHFWPQTGWGHLVSVKRLDAWPEVWHLLHKNCFSKCQVCLICQNGKGAGRRGQEEASVCGYITLASFAVENGCLFYIQELYLFLKGKNELWAIVL